MKRFIYSPAFGLLLCLLSALLCAALVGIALYIGGGW
jgi:hypothetical protein